jgi:hypothetical protein
MERPYEPEAFEKRLTNWLLGVRYFTRRYEGSRGNYTKFLKLFSILKFCLLHEPREVRKLFLRVLRTTWGINPRLMKRAVIVMMYYWNFYAFVNDTSWRKQKS